MSGAASLAAAKRRRTATVNTGNQSNRDTTNARSTNQQPEQIITPMSILTQHHVRLREIESYINALDNVGGNEEITNFDSRLARIEQRINNIEAKLKRITSTNEGDNAPDSDGPTFGGGLVTVKE
tara:strand:- start:308 stop:682 length:375 start_codon:yes stop_codon:yes gene_type:complete